MRGVELQSPTTHHDAEGSRQPHNNHDR
jgi:hypothetical protein